MQSSETRDPAAVLTSVARILRARSPEELLGCADASLVYEILLAASERGSSPRHAAIRIAAQQHGVSLDDLADRADLMLGAIRGRQRLDLYRILDVPPLASEPVIRHRWLALVKETHPDRGGDVARFHEGRRAYEVLSDPDRRAAYEEFWRRTIAPFHRFVPPLVDGDARRVHTPATRPAPDLDDRISRLCTAVTEIESALAPTTAQELAGLGTEVASAIARLEALRATLAAIASAKRLLSG